MKNTKNQEKRPQALKQKLMSALAMLLIATILMSTTTYAWFVLSTAPEVTGIETQVGANGSLEIALLTKETREDMSLIQSGFAGGSLQEDQITANNAWGNLVDLSYASYGLSDLLLLPARLDTSDGISVDLNKLLVVPNYGYDGRILDVSGESVSGTYDGANFMFSNEQDFGVRAVGTSNALTPQQAGLGSAKTNISTYTKGAQNNARNTLTRNGSGLFDVIVIYATEGDSGLFEDENRDVLYSIVLDLAGALDYIELSLRQSLVAYAASELGDEDEFAAARDLILDAGNSLDDLLSQVGTVPAGFGDMVAKLKVMQNNLGVARTTCEGLTDGSYTWEEVKPILTNIMDVNKILIEGKGINELDQDMLMGLIGGTIEMTLAPGSGLFADIADFAGNFTSNVQYLGGTVVEMMTVSAQDPVFLVGLLAEVDALSPAGGGAGAAALPMEATYGYALDLAFRCNAAMPDLVLQTKGVQRVYNGGEDPDEAVSTASSTQGSGSYMEFTTTDATLTVDQMLALMDAIRVGFLDDQGTIMGIAKLNIQSREVDGGAIKAPLYLYNYEFKTDESGTFLTMGERKLTDNTITDLQQNVAKAVTVVVWLDGDLVDNSMVSADRAASMGGRLNLQFATSAELVPAADGSMLNYTADKAGLEALLEDLADEFAAGQLNATNVSWNAFAAAYNRAIAVNENDNAGQVEIANAVKALRTAGNGLTEVSTDAIVQKTTAVRAMMGQTDEIARYVIVNEDGSYSAVGDQEYTQEEFDSWNKVGEIKSVDFNKNMLDEGNGVYTTIYSDASWNALASALYQAEATAMNENASEDAINAALTALDNAEKALERRVFFAPYDYNGDLYYMARWMVDEADTYGRWYDSNFKRILSEATMLKLDAYAQDTVIGELNANYNDGGDETVWISSDDTYITPDISFLAAVYPELRDVEVKGVHWDEIDTAFFTEMADETHYTKLSEVIAIYNSTELDAVRPDADNLPAAYTTAVQLWNNHLDNDYSNDDETAATVNIAIADLNTVIVGLYEDLAEKDTPAVPVMTENQRILLTAAISAAKAVEGYEDMPSDNGLRIATEAAEQALVEDTTMDEATQVLAVLNAALHNSGVDEITEYNTLTNKLPEGMSSSDIVYNVDYPGIKLKLTGKSGNTTLGATILTQDGVVLKVRKDIILYDRPDDLWFDLYVNEAAASFDIDSVALTVGDEYKLTVALHYEEGGNNTEDKPLDELVREEIVSVEWYAEYEGPEMLTIGEESGSGKVLLPGSATIHVRIETNAGNVYTREVPVTIAAASENP